MARTWDQRLWPYAPGTAAVRLSLRPTGELVEVGALGRATEAQRRRQLEVARRAGLREFKREDLGRIRFGRCEADGIAFKILRGEVDPLDGRAVAFFHDVDASLVFLERP